MKKDYLKDSIYRDLQKRAVLLGYDTFAVVYIKGDNKKVVKLAKLPTLEELELEEIADAV